MSLAFMDGAISAVIIRFLIDITSVLLLLKGIYYNRYGDKELMTAALLFNIFIFAVLTILSSVNFSINAGFGLFAILALFTLRSEQITKIQITYFFGSVAIAVICSVQGTPLPVILTTIVILITCTYFLDHPSFLPSVYGVKITLDKIDADAIANPVKMCAELSERLGVKVLSYQIISLDFIHDMAVLNVNYRNH